MLGKLPTEFDVIKIRKAFGLDVSPTSVVLLQELERFNKLIKKMGRSLATLRRVSRLSALLEFTLTRLRSGIANPPPLNSLAVNMRKNLFHGSGNAQ